MNTKGIINLEWKMTNYIKAVYAILIAFYPSYMIAGLTCYAFLQKSKFNSLSDNNSDRFCFIILFHLLYTTIKVVRMEYIIIKRCVKFGAIMFPTKMIHT